MKAGGFWAAGGGFYGSGNDYPLADLGHYIDVGNVNCYGLGQLAMD